MSHELSERRESNPNFTFQSDAVYLNDEGHQFITDQLIGWFGDQSDREGDQQTQKLVCQRLNLRRDAYHHAAGHKRSVIRPGLPIAQAEQLTKRINHSTANRSSLTE